MLQLINLVLLIYCVMTFVMPQSNLTRSVAGYVEPLLQPLRRLLYRYLPKLRGMAVDFSPLAVWVVIQVLIWVLNLLRRILF